LTNADHLFFILLYRWFPSILNGITIIRPETRVRWQRAGFRNPGGRPPIGAVRLGRRELVWINVTRHPTAEWIAQQITETFPWNDGPRYLIRDRDAIFGAAVTISRSKSSAINGAGTPAPSVFAHVHERSSANPGAA
jgi:hypothetical protein